MPLVLTAAIRRQVDLGILLWRLLRLFRFVVVRVEDLVFLDVLFLGERRVETLATVMFVRSIEAGRLLRVLVALGLRETKYGYRVED